MMNTLPVFESLMAGKDLSDEDMRAMLFACMQGTLSDAEVAAFLALLRMKGESVSELVSAARVLEELAQHVSLGERLVDIVGTGGDGKNTFNISTVSSFVAAAAGVSVAKHGNRAVSGKSGSADLLTLAGFNLQPDEDTLKASMRACNIALLFAPHYHETLLRVRPVRKALGFRTFFNLLGPLINPARARLQVVGVCTTSLQEPIARVLAELGRERVLVVCSEDGLDEISPCAPTRVVEYANQRFSHWTLYPEAFDCRHPSLEPIIVNSPAESLALANAVLEGCPGPARAAVILNAAAAIYCATPNLDLKDAIEKAKTAIDSGAALACFNMASTLSHTGSPS
ncbi:anthranilate phosphoribosyltransferase [Legionella geestiana]|nr:anthranilate phosphoribosyltransferase [Legionella geestiana]QDQ38943.1 anthranilate phosphoribosyltransferase [Legionella geestiana]